MGSGILVGNVTLTSNFSPLTSQSAASGKFRSGFKSLPLDECRYSGFWIPARPEGGFLILGLYFTNGFTEGSLVLTAL